MIDPRELRIGNYINYDDEGKLWAGICFGIHYIEQVHYIEPSEYKILVGNQIRPSQQCFPILLTEEWLLKFGFETQNKGASFFRESGKILLLVYNQIQQKRFVFNFEREEIVINSVHQLQNLYFALTGEELT